MLCGLFSFQDEVEECSVLSLDVSPAFFVRNQREFYNIHIAPTSELFLFIRIYSLLEYLVCDGSSELKKLI